MTAIIKRIRGLDIPSQIQKLKDEYNHIMKNCWGKNKLYTSHYTGKRSFEILGEIRKLKEKLKNERKKNS